MYSIDPCGSTVVLSANPRRASRTLRVGREVAARFGSAEADVIEISEFASQLLSSSADDALHISEVMQRIRSAGRLVVATPSYKGSYPGLLKVLFDRFVADDLSGVLAIPVVTAGSAEHLRTTSIAITALLTELGAGVVLPAVTVAEPDFEIFDELVDSWVVRLDRIRSALGVPGAAAR